MGHAHNASPGLLPVPCTNIKNTVRPIQKKKLTIAEIVTQSGVLSEKINRCASPKLVAEVFSIMHNDEVGDVARSDRLVIVLGNQWMEKNIGNTLKRGKYTSEIMRLVARLLIALRKVAGKQMSMWDFLNPENFDNIVKATLMVAAADMDDEDDLLYPSNARKLGFDIKRLCNLKIGLCIQGKDQQGQNDSENLMKLMNIFWGMRVAKLANVLLEERQFNSTKSLPMPEDIQKLNENISENIATLPLDPSNFREAAELGLVKLMVYNRRRTGEMEGCR